MATARWFWSRYRLVWIAAAGLLLAACAGGSRKHSGGAAGDDSGSSSDGDPVVNDQAGSLGSMSGAIHFDNHHMRCISGENDGFGGGNPDGERTELTTITNLTCDNAWTCLQSDASGWGMVKATDVTDGTADHCYFILNGSGTCANTSSSLDTKFTSGSYFWSLDPNLDWLASFAVH